MATVDKVNKNIDAAFKRRKAQLYQLAIRFAADALNYFRALQPPGRGVEGKFWTNQTNQAEENMIAQAFQEMASIGWTFGHGIEYGVYLELANNGKHAAIRTIMSVFASKFIKAAKELIE